MNIAGSGVKGDLGSPPQASIREIETTAAVEVAKAAMKIVTDTMQISLLVVDKDFLKYQSPPPYPTLKPLESNRIATSFTQAPDESWRSTLDDMVNLMPADFRELFLASQSLPKNQQSADFILLNNTLETMAKLIGWTAAASLPIAPGSPAALLTEANLMLPYIALGGATQNGAMVLNQVQQYLETVGANDPNFDAISAYSGALAPLVDDLNTALLQLADSATQAEGRAALAEIASKLGVLGNSFDRLYSGNDLLMLSNTIHSLETTAQSLSLSQPGSAALLLTLTASTVGIKNSDSALGIFGSGYSAITDAFRDGIDQATSGSLPPASLTLFNQLATTIFTSALLWGSLNYEATGATNPKESSPESTSEKNFGYGLLMQMLDDTSTLSTLSASASNAADIKGSEASTTSSLLTTMTQLALISASINGSNLSATEPLLKNQGDSLLAGIATASSLLSEGLLAGTLSSEAAEHLNVYLKQAAIALEQENPDGLSAAIDSSIELTGTTPTAVANDVNSLKSTAHSVQDGLVMSSDEIASNCTGVYIAA